jgi:putative AdoMet-dependent methyltransferase
MLDKAREKLPFATLVRHDLRADWPHEIDRRFDRIVSAYVFHHFELEKKLSLCRELVDQHLLPGGKLVLADLSFAEAPAMAAFARTAGELWEVEPYWLANESVEALKRAGLNVQYVSVSSCAGVYGIESNELLRPQD